MHQISVLNLFGNTESVKVALVTSLDSAGLGTVPYHGRWHCLLDVHSIWPGSPSGYPRYLAVCLVTASQVSEPVRFWVCCGCHGQVRSCHPTSANLTTVVTGQWGQTENTVSTHTRVATLAPSGFCSDLLCSRCGWLSVTLKAPLLCLKVIQPWSLLLTTIVLRDLLLKYIYFFKICCCSPVLEKNRELPSECFLKVSDL